jgi:hypothetical protein
MVKITAETTKIADECLASLLETATNDAIRTKLKNLHEVCRSIVQDSRQRLSVPEVLRRYHAKVLDSAQAIAEQTIRNKRANRNPYLALYRKWEEVAEHVIASTTSRTMRPGGGIIHEGDIRAIEDPVLRHQVFMLMAQNRSLHNQINILREAQSAVPLKVEPRKASPTADLALTDGELEAVCDFVDPRKLGPKQMVRTPDDGVKLRDGRIVADPGFLTALEKIARSYGRL